MEMAIQKEPASQTGFFTPRLLFVLAFSVAGVGLATLSVAATLVNDVTTPQANLPSDSLAPKFSEPLFLAVGAAAPAPASAATLTGTITTVAGGMSGKVPALWSNLFPIGVARDTQGNIYVTDSYHDIVRRIDLS